MALIVYPSRKEQMEKVGNAPTTPSTPPRWKSVANTPQSSQQNNQSSQPPAPGGLFGSSTQTSQAGGGLFGSSTQTSQPQQSGGLFGSSTTQQNTGGGGLFGSNTQQNSNTGGGGLFGNTNNQQQQSGTGGMFGQQTSQPQQSGGLFGGSLFGNQQNAQNKPGGLFGASTTGANTGGSSLFGGNAQNTNTGGSSLFGGNTQQNTGGSSLFGRPNPNGNQAQQQSIFGLSASQPTYTQPSLLGASQYRAGSRTTPFAGKLSMGQSAAPQQPPPGTTKYSYDGMRPTTRFAELVDDVQKELEAIDKMIQMQEKFCRDIEGFVPKHGDDVDGLGRDVDYIREKVEAAEQSLGVDAQGVQAQQGVLAADKKDFDRCQRVVDMLAHPQQYHYSGLNYGSTARLPTSTSTSTTTALDAVDADKREMDITNNYFAPMATSLKQTLDTYASNLSEIEAHMRVIEHSTQMQGHALAAKRAGVGGGAGQGGNTDATVRELAETLRGFEESILNAAGLVGQCREGVNDVILGRVGGGRREVGRRW